MLSVFADGDKLGLYNDAEPKHKFQPSAFQRSVDYCGSCHDVSNPAVGDLSPNNSAQSTADTVSASGSLGGPVEGKAAFNNFPYMYGVVERTFSEYKASLLSQTLIQDFNTLPEDLKTAGGSRGNDFRRLVGGWQGVDR